MKAKLPRPSYPLQCSLLIIYLLVEIRGAGMEMQTDLWTQQGKEQVGEL